MAQKTQIPPYVAYRTFRNFLTQLESQGLPARIDRSVLVHKSGSVQSQLLLALRYLKLISQSGRPTEELRSLLEGHYEARRARLGERLREVYAFVFDSGFKLESGTSDQVEELFKQTGATGATLRRCISFFVAAAKDSGLRVSPYIKPHRTRRASAREKEKNPPQHPSLPRSTDGMTKNLRLRGGGTLTFDLNVDWFSLSEQDRGFIFDLIDRIREYEKRASTRSDD